ncbi:MAG: hypothetical protein WAR59_04445 [Ignavibacteriaceae bacterium]
MKYLLFICIIVSIILLSCDDEITNPIDKELSQKIIGKWITNQSETFFYADGTTTSTTIDYYNTNNPQKDSMIITVTAKYKIQNKVLFITERNIDITASSSTIEVAIAKLLPSAIEIIGDTLFITSVNVFDKLDGPNNELDGRWFTKYDCFILKPNVTITLGTEELDYYFDTQSHYYSLSLKLYLDGVGYETDSGNFQVENGMLNMGGPNVYKMKIESNKLYLFNNHTSKIIRGN